MLRVWEDEPVHIKGSYCLLSVPLSGTLLSRDFSLSMREESCTGSPLFHVFHVVIQTPQFGMPFYISTLIFKAPFSAPLHCSYSHFDTSLLRWEGATAGAITVLIDFWRRVCTVTSSPVALCKRWERCTFTAESELDSEMWEHNHIWLAVWITGAGCGSFLPHRYHDAIFDSSFAYTEHNACVSVNLKEMNIQTKTA